ncbi:Tektin-4 [Plecturocebus cupreus]
MAQMDVLLTKEPAPQTVPPCELPCKVSDVARNTGTYTSSGLATAGFRTAKYLLEEWFQNCHTRYHQAFADRDQSERQRHESQSSGWSALDATEVPFSIATDNLQCCERRQHPNLVRDHVETELLKAPPPAPPQCFKNSCSSPKPSAHTKSAWPALTKACSSWACWDPHQGLALELRAFPPPGSRAHPEHSGAAEENHHASFEPDPPLLVTTGTGRLGASPLKRALGPSLLRGGSPAGPSLGKHPRQTGPALHRPRLNREHKETCEMDWSDKVEAYNIDETCGRIHSQSTEVQSHPHSTSFQERWALPLRLPWLWSPSPGEPLGAASPSPAWRPLPPRALGQLSDPGMSR